MGAFLSKPAMRRTSPTDPDHVEGKPWVLVNSCSYYSAVAGETIVVPAGFRTDFASVPWMFRRLFPQDGPWTLAAVVHDYFCEEKLRTSKVAAQVFREAMLDLGVPKWKAGSMYRAVLWFGPRWD